MRFFVFIHSLYAEAAAGKCLMVIDEMDVCDRCHCSSFIGASL